MSNLKEFPDYFEAHEYDLENMSYDDIVRMVKTGELTEEVLEGLDNGQDSI